MDARAKNEQSPRNGEVLRQFRELFFRVGGALAVVAEKQDANKATREVDSGGNGSRVGPGAEQ